MGIETERDVMFRGRAISCSRVNLTMPPEPCWRQAPSSSKIAFFRQRGELPDDVGCRFQKLFRQFIPGEGEGCRGIDPFGAIGPEMIDCPVGVRERIAKRKLSRSGEQ